MEIVNGRLFKWDEVAESNLDKASKTVFYTSDSTSGSVWCIKPGQEVSNHLHSTSDDIWVCVAGTGIFYPDNGVELPIQKGDIIVSVKGSQHGMKNTGEEDFIFISIVAPVPSDIVPLP